MILGENRKNGLETELIFSASKSSGPGGQNVNKVNTKVELRFSIKDSQFLSPYEKSKIKISLKNRINTEGELLLVSQVERSQWRNREKVCEKFFQLIEMVLTPTKKRIKTKPTSSSRLKRLDGKKRLGRKKELRRSPEL